MSEQELKMQEKQNARTQGENTKNETFYAPQVDIYETEKEVIVVADMPGVLPDGVDLSLEDNVLTIQGRREGKNMAVAWCWKSTNLGIISGALPWRKPLTRSISRLHWPMGFCGCACPRLHQPSPRK